MRTKSPIQTKTKMQVRSFYATFSSRLNIFLAGFISNHEGDDDEPSSRRHHAALDAQRHFEEEDRSPEQIAKDLSERYSGRTSVRYTGDMNEIPQRLLMPSVHDASLWQVRVKVRLPSLRSSSSNPRPARPRARHRVQSYAQVH